ncbi:hypothetical protein Tco_0625459 [Tanacetum coccineum]|uniref:Uncharacterized protein n=1 Tax=Tanacetum coccineum TaxID=301880 RepID=A0ABQ4WGU2_9ASTR
MNGLPDPVNCTMVGSIETGRGSQGGFQLTKLDSGGMTSMSLSALCRMRIHAVMSRFQKEYVEKFEKCSVSWMIDWLVVYEATKHGISTIEVIHRNGHGCCAQILPMRSQFAGNGYFLSMALWEYSQNNGEGRVCSLDIFSRSSKQYALSNRRGKQVLFEGESKWKKILKNTMAERNVPTQPPTRTDEQIISVDILSNTKFFQPSLPSKCFLLSTAMFGTQSKYNEEGRNLKFVPKGESVEVFGMAIPDPLITKAIQQSSYYPKYLEMVAENTKKTPQESASVQPATKCATPKKPTTTTPVKQSKPAPPPTKKPSKPQQESIPREEAFLPQGRAPVGGVTIREPISETTSKLHEVVGKGKAVVTEEQVAHSLIDLSKKKRTTDQFILVRRDQTSHDSTTRPSSQPEDDTSERVIHESSSTSDSERTESETETAAPKGDKDQGEVDSSTVTSGVSIPVIRP